MAKQFIKVGLVSTSDRASSGIYADKGIPSLQEWLNKTVVTPIEYHTRLLADEQKDIEQTLIDLVDYQGCHLILTTGGTGPAARDVTPEATLNVADKIMPGFGEQMRQISLNFVPTAILSRQVAVIRKQCLIINLPGQPKAIAQILEGLKDDSGNIKVHGIFAAIPYCLDLLASDESPMPYLETNQATVNAFRPANAIKRT
ncbi:MoaB Molybdopterin biosynthesis enzymes [Methylophilaceae bacterium]